MCDFSDFRIPASAKSNQMLSSTSTTLLRIIRAGEQASGALPRTFVPQRHSRESKDTVLQNSDRCFLVICEPLATKTRLHRVRVVEAIGRWRRLGLRVIASGPQTGIDVRRAPRYFPAKRFAWRRPPRHARHASGVAELKTHSLTVVRIDLGYASSYGERLSSRPWRTRHRPVATNIALPISMPAGKSAAQSAIGLLPESHPPGKSRRVNSGRSSTIGPTVVGRRRRPIRILLDHRAGALGGLFPTSQNRRSSHARREREVHADIFGRVASGEVHHGFVVLWPRQHPTASPKLVSKPAWPRITTP